MRHAVMAALFLTAGAAAAFGQDERDKKVDELKREFERSMKGLQERFDQERARMEKEFRAARERLLEKRGDPGDKKEPRGVEELLHEVLKRVESIEKRLDGEMPRLREFRQVLPRDFDFKRLPQGMPEEFRKWLEQMPKLHKEEEKREEKKEEKKKPKKKEDED